MATYGAAALAALGDRTRQAIVELLAAGPRAVGEIAGGLPVSRPAVSQHLRVLKDAGLMFERAWEVYTAGYGSWYPRDHFIGSGPAQTVVIEPVTGGRRYEKQPDGSEPEWGRVLAWEPPHRLVLAWMVGGDWKHDPLFCAGVPREPPRSGDRRRPRRSGSGRRAAGRGAGGARTVGG